MNQAEKDRDSTDYDAQGIEFQRPHHPAKPKLPDSLGRIVGILHNRLS